MEIIGGMLYFIVAVVVYPLLTGAFYYLFTAGPIWGLRYLLIFMFNAFLYPLMKIFAVIPLIGRSIAYLISFIVIVTVSTTSLLLISFPYFAMFIDFLTGENMEWDGYPLISFFKTIFGGFADYIRLSNPDSLFSNPSLAVPIIIGKIIFEVPFLIFSIVTTLMIPIRSFLWLAKSWAKIAFN